MQGNKINSAKSLAFREVFIYRNKLKQPEFEDFILPFSGKLRSNNRWVILSKIIPWDEIDKKYSKGFAKSGMGAPAKSSRIAFGALIIKERLGLTDEETVEQIIENPYLQYFLGYECYIDEAPFEASMMVHFRKRFDMKGISEINEKIINDSNKVHKKKNKDDDNYKTGAPPNKGKLILDATCSPADIRYPTDLSLLNEAREKIEHIIDVLYEPLKDKEKKVRTYRKNARKDFLNIAKKKNVSRKEIRKGIGKQLRYLRRDLKHIKSLIQRSSLAILSKKEYRDLLVIHELYRQQKYMYDNNTNKIEGRIVSISQPHVRPIVRGKARAKVEFGAKLSVSLVNGYSHLEDLNWEPYNESKDLIPVIERYNKAYGYYPKSVHVDKIYRTRNNILYCKENGIRITGPPLGRPKKNVNHKKQKALNRRDERDRIPIEGKFGQGKRRFSLNRIMAKLSCTSETVIAVIFVVMNLEKRLVFLLLSILNFIKKCANIGTEPHYIYFKRRALNLTS